MLVLATGLAVSTAGDAAALVALLLQLRPEGSGWVAALLAGELAPIVVLAPIVGLVVDRFETRRVLLVALVGQAALAVPLALVSAPWATVALFTLLGSLGAMVRPATSALVPAITGEDGASRGYSRLATGMSLGWIAGPAAGGLLTGAFGASVVLLVDAVTFAALALAGFALRVRRPPQTAPTVGVRRAAEARAGFHLLWHDPVLRVAMLVSAVAIGCAVVDNVAAPFRFVEQLGTSDAGYGTYLALWGAGALLGVQVLPLVGGEREETALAAGNLLSGLGIAGIGLAPNLVVALAASLLGGVGNGLSNVGQNAVIARRTPAPLRGRAFAAASALVQTAIGLGTAAAAPAVSLLQADGSMVTAGSLSTVGATLGVVLAVRRRRLVSVSG